ncbi:MAG: BatA domain-containing protein, partial [Bacteroidales bacterium]|nr:BatA domain-containing protein [Bacteroidales bacterium]
MEFVYPGVLFGLLAVGIPVIIHLFNFRRFKKVYFTNVRFIREIKTETQKQSRLRHLLVLIMRMFAIACIVLAFARPFIPLKNDQVAGGGKKGVSIYIDNSFSMSAESAKGNLLEEAKDIAIDIVKQYQTTDVFQVLTNDFKGRHQKLMNRDEFINELSNIEISPSVVDLDDIVTRQLDLLRAGDLTVKHLFLLSDFQQSVVNKSLPEPDSSEMIIFAPLGTSGTENLYIDSCWFASPVKQKDQQATLMARIYNTSDQVFEKIPVKLMIGNTQRAVASFDVRPDSYTDVALHFTNYDEGNIHGWLEINDFPVTFDDKLFFSFRVAEQLHILSINGGSENRYLNSLFKNDSLFQFDNVLSDNIRYASISEYNLIVLNELKRIPSGLAQELSLYVENGGTLIVLPAQNADLENYKNFLVDIDCIYYTAIDSTGKKIDFINLDDPFYFDVFEGIPENIDLPDVDIYYIIPKLTRSVYTTILQIEGGDPFLVLNKKGKGNVFLFAAPFSGKFSGFPKHAIFVPTLYQIALAGITAKQPYCIIGKDEG